VVEKIDFPQNGDGTSLPGGGTTKLGGGTAISGGGTPDTGGGTPFRPVPAEFSHWLYNVVADNTVYLHLFYEIPRKFSENWNLQQFKAIQSHRSWCQSNACTSC